MRTFQKTAVVLVTYNHWDLTERCLSDLFSQKSKFFEVFVADNGSSDGTLQNIERNFPDVKTVLLADNRGFGAANNAACRLFEKSDAPFDSIFFLNNDTRVPSGTIESLQSDLSKYPDDIVSPQLLNEDKSIQVSWFSKIPHGQFFLNAFRSESRAARHVNGKTVPFDGPKFRLAGWTNAAAWMMSRATWETVGGFDENIFMYYEDVDWAYRAIALGKRFLIDSETPVIHLGGGSAKTSLSRSLQHDGSQLYFYKKHFGLKGALLSRAFRLVRSLLRLGILLPVALFKDSARKGAKIHFKLFIFALRSGGFNK